MIRKAFLLCACSTLIFAETWLSEEKEAILHHQSKQIDATHEKLRNEWISPLILKGQSTREHSVMGTTAQRTGVGASISQDIFRSGGIEYSIDYADSKFSADRISLVQTIASLRQEVCLNVLSYHKNLLLLKQSDLKLKNNEIEIFLKRKQYEAGAVDITLLNRALMDKSSELKANASLQASQGQIIQSHQSISDTPIESIELPRFTLISKDTFISDSLSLQYENAMTRTNSDRYNLTRSSYLPSLTLNADGGIQHYDATPNDFDGSYYSAGVSLSMPLSYTANATKQEALSTMLTQKAKSADTKRKVQSEYANALIRIQNHEQIIQIFETNLTYYDELIQTTKTAVESGYKPGYDLITLQNTRAIEAIEIELRRLEIQAELAKLHFAHTKELP